MKKIMTLMLVVLTTSIFAADWYSTKELMTDLKPMEFSKDTAWYGYGSPAWGWGLTEERATFYNLEDFGFEYPVTLHGMTSYLLDNGNDYSYIIYDKDGVTVLFQTAESTAFEGYNDYYFSPDSLILFDDFYMAIVPAVAGGPGAVTSDIVTESNSYLGGPGAWEPMFINDEIYELINYVALSPFNGPDIFQPVVKEVIGAATFMDKDIQLTMIAQDPNGVLSPVSAEYSIDGGAWNVFSLNEAKGYHTFKGVIPAQADGTIGSVRFNVSDSLANAGLSKEFPISWSKDNYILDESFEGSFPPDGWTLNTAGADWIQFERSAAYVNVRTGNYCASHNDDNIPAIETDWLISPPIDVPVANSVTLSFWQVGRYINYMEAHEVAISNDDGITWTTIYVDTLDAGNADVQYELTEELFSLGAYQGDTILIGWGYTGDYSDEWYIDDVTLRYDYEGPEIVKVEGNTALLPDIGAYLNNDLVLNVTAFDLTGVKSVTGHYSYDGGTTWTDLVFAAAKAGNEIWTATIPAESATIAGIINFDLVDLGDVVSPTTANYDFEFVGDIDGPDFTYVTGTLAFLNDPMNLTIAFTDESAISSCSGAYSSDNWVTQYDFILTPSKVNEYTYVASLPAETADVLDGKVAFSIADAEGNVTNTLDYLVQWKDGQQSLWEDFETGTDGWYLGGNWGLEEGTYTSATNALTESPGGNYSPSESSVATQLVAMDWTTYLGAEMSFWCKYDIEHAFDYMYFDVTKDNGVTWTTIKTWDDEGIPWHEERVALDAFVGTNGFNFRFRFSSDTGYEADGMYIDDIEIITYNVDYAAPLPVYAPYEPEFYEGALADFTNNVDILELTGVDAVEVVWSVDGAAQTNIVATIVAGDQWEFTIPAQPAGSLIEYTFWTRDTSGYANEATFETIYTIIAGEHMAYDANIVSYFNTATDGDAKAVRITVPGTVIGTTMFKADLTYLLFNMYADTGNQSDDMTVRVWADTLLYAVSGADSINVPGREILTPFDITPAANANQSDKIEMIDLTGEGLIVYGDFWVGYSAPASGEVFGTQEDTGETGTPAYDRAVDGAWNGTNWDWSVYVGTNYLMRAVLGTPIDVSGIENGNIPLTTSLEQNYPNPFNPTTTINFTIVNDAKVSLVVYDVMGRTVAKLVNGNLSQGSHKVSFDASSMVSGVYYYNLKAGNVNQTKKMMLIK